MKNYTMKNRILLLLLILSVSLGMFFILFIPENNKLKDVTIQNYYHVSEAKYEYINNVINGHIDTTLFMSSRTVIRNKIVEYNDGLITFQELHDFSYEKYNDGYVVMEDAVEGIRIVDGQILLSVGIQTVIDTTEIVETVHGLRTVKYEIIHNNEDYIIVYSPITESNDILGYDVIVYDLEGVLNSIQQDDYTVDLVLSDDYTDDYKPTSSEYIYISDSEYVYLKEVSDTHSLYISISEDDLFSEVNTILVKNLLMSILIIAAVMIFGNLVLLKNTKDLVRELSKNHDMYKDKALTDNLTKTYSRQFLDQLMYDGSLRVSPTTIIMLDIDRFKTINDKFGHLVGDEVLRFIGEHLKNTFNVEDHVIRYGGDEFLIFVKSINKDAVVNLLKQFNEIINQTSKFKFDLSISYGICFVESLSDIDEGIRKADKKLYIYKDMKKDC